MAFAYYRSVTIDHTKVASTQTNFPVLVSVTLTDLKTVGNSGVVTSSSAFDVVFASNTAGTSKLKWEVEKYDPTTGELVAWVLIASLSSSADTVIYLCYGDSGVTTFQGDVNGTWDSNFKVVYHLGGPSAGTLVLTDSTSNGKTLSNQSPPFKAVTAKVGTGGDFTNSAGATAGAGLYNSSFGNPGFPLTFECWFQIPSTGSYRTFLANNGNANDGIRIGAEPGNKPEYVRGSIAEHVFSSLATLVANTWYYFAVTINGTAVTGYLAAAGGSLASQGLTVTASYNGTPNYINVNSTTSGSVDGGKYLDEARVSNVARSADWIGTCFKNQDSPSTFLAVGSATPNVTDFPQSVTIAHSVTAAASEAMAAAAAATVAVSATASASEVTNAAESVSIGVSIEATAGTAGIGYNKSVTIDVSAGAASSVTASAAVTIPVSAGAAATEATNAPKAVTVAVAAALAVQQSQRLLPGTIQSGESFGTPNVAGPMNPGTIASGESFGTPTVNVRQTASPGTITSGESFGTPRVSHVDTMRPGTIASGESFGTPTASLGNRPMLPGTIPSGESFGAPTLSGGKNTLQVFVGNYDRSRWLRRGSARLQSQTLGRWSGSIEFQNIPGGDLTAIDTVDEWTPQHGQTILIKEFGRALMRGCIKELTATRALSTNLVTYTCQIADKTAICDRRVIRVAYPDVSQNLKQWDIADVIRDIHANYLDGEGIVLDPDLPASLGDLTTPLSPFIKVTQAYDTLRDITGLQWFIDLNQVLRFTDTEEAEEAPFEITETSKNWRNLSVKISDADYRNRQYVVSNRKILPTASGAGGSSRVESYTLLDFGTGHTPIFPDHTGYQQEAFGRGMELGYIVLQFGIGSITGIKVNGVSKHVYQEEQLTESILFGTDDWWAYFTSQTVDFVFPHFFLNAGDVVEITYVPATNTAAANADPVLVVEQPFEPAPGELFGTCGSGRYDAVEQVNDVGTQEGLDAIAAGLLERSGVIPKIATVETDVPGAQIGQRLHVDVLRQLCDNLDMFITGLVGQSVDGEDLGHGSSFRWTVTATNFPDVGNWKKTWERLWRRTQHPQPIDRTVAATVILAPGAALRNNSNFNTPRKVDETGLLFEIVCKFDTPPVDQDLVIDIKVDGVSILTSARLVVPAGFTGDVVLTDFARANLYLFKDQTITGLCTYRVTGAHPVAARNGTISIRTTA